MIKITICPTCGSDKIKKARRNWTGKAQGKTYNVPNLEYYECPDCGEKVYDREAMRKIEERSPVFSKRQAKKAA
jgi:YgiT-type zinc finger domain-containing protein